MSNPTEVMTEVATPPTSVRGRDRRDPAGLAATARSLGRVAQFWLDSSAAERQEAVVALQVSTGYKRNAVDAAITSAFEELTEPKLLEFISQEPAFQRLEAGPDKVLHVLAGNVFTSWLPGAVTTLLLGSRCDLKPSTREPVFASLWKNSVGRIDPELGERIGIVRWQDHLLQEYPAVVAYGADTTLKNLKAKVPPQALFVGYGHKLSAAVIWRDALTAVGLPQLMDRLEKDVSPFDLEGCLSPQMIFVDGEDPGIFEQLFARVNVMPHLKRFDSLEELMDELQPLWPTLSAVGFAGDAVRTQSLREVLMSRGVSRICSIGEMQQPPLTWRNGGFSLADVLTRG